MLCFGLLRASRGAHTGPGRGASSLLILPGPEPLPCHQDAIHEAVLRAYADAVLERICYNSSRAPLCPCAGTLKGRNSRMASAFFNAETFAGRLFRRRRWWRPTSSASAADVPLFQKYLRILKWNALLLNYSTIPLNIQRNRFGFVVAKLMPPNPGTKPWQPLVFYSGVSSKKGTPTYPRKT